MCFKTGIWVEGVSAWALGYSGSFYIAAVADWEVSEGESEGLGMGGMLKSWILLGGLRAEKGVPLGLSRRMLLIPLYFSIL